MDSNSKVEPSVDASVARNYMKQVAQPVLSPLIAALAVDQPCDVREYILQYFQDPSVSTEPKDPPQPLCETTGLPADFKVLNKNGQISYFIADIHDAMKRKGKLRGCASAPIGDPFPEEDNHATLPTSLSVDVNNRIDERPVTPPNRGFKVTLPGQHFRDDQGPVSGKSTHLTFEPRALGGGDSNEEATLEQKREQRMKAAQGRVEEAPSTGIERLLSDEQKVKLKEKQERDSLLGRIRAYYARIGGVEPFGLAAAPTNVLVDHLQKCKMSSMKVAQNARTKKEVPKKLHNLVTGAPGGKQRSSEEVNEKRVLSFTPRALGTTERSTDVTPDDRRRRALEAATRRLSG